MHSKNPFYGYQGFARRNAPADEAPSSHQEPHPPHEEQHQTEGVWGGADPFGADNENPLGNLFPPGVAGLVPPDMQGQDSSGDDIPGEGDKTGEVLAEPAISDLELALLCRERICPNCSVQQEADAERLRAVADLDNARKRLQREKEEQSRFAAEAVLADILPAMDNLGLALQYSPKDEQSKNFVTGVDMTRNLFVEALKKHGLLPVGAIGELFDPAIHEAVSTANDPDFQDNHVCSLLTCGYSLNGRLLRPAKVVVCKKG